ncbi:MAG: hypothetical protein Q8R28_06570 [Dehalococcoidia bacterium]|nr:hypothetical protein [Dehalococcoidia bacterium]
MARKLQPLKRKRMTQREQRRIWVKGILLRRGITVVALARHLNISRAHLTRALWDRKHFLGQVTSQRLVRALGVDILSTYLPPAATEPNEPERQNG